jgi:hypothetical protein
VVLSVFNAANGAPSFHSRMNSELAGSFAVSSPPAPSYDWVPGY